MITIGQQGRLGNEILTVVSINGGTFKCDNGKMYITANAKWLTNQNQPIEYPKTKKEARELTAEEKGRLAYLELTGNDTVSLMRKSTANYRNSKSGMSSLIK